VFALLPLLAAVDRRWLVATIGLSLAALINFHGVLTTPLYATPNIENLPLGELARGPLAIAVSALLATGGLLFFIQSFATFLWTTDHRSVRLTLPILEVGGMFVSFARLLAFLLSIVAMVVLYLFLTRTFIGTAIRAVAQDRGAMALMGGNPQRIYVVTAAVGGAMAGVAATLLSIQYSVHPHFGAAFGPITFMICVLGGLGNMVGAFLASFLVSEIISVGGVLWSTEMGYVVAFVLFIVVMFIRPGGLLARPDR
jgi:branched-chain amino acid transport system permease protein